MEIMKTFVVNEKCPGNVAEKILTITWMNVNLSINVLTVVVTIQSLQDSA